jgi:hypothetical protein
MLIANLEVRRERSSGIPGRVSTAENDDAISDRRPSSVGRISMVSRRQGPVASSRITSCFVSGSIR